VYLQFEYQKVTESLPRGSLQLSYLVAELCIRRVLQLGLARRTPTDESVTIHIGRANLEKTSQKFAVPRTLVIAFRAEESDPSKLYARILWNHICSHNPR